MDETVRLRKKISKVRGRTFDEHRSLLQQLGDYLINTVPTNLDPLLLQDLENLLNELYAHAVTEPDWNDDLADALLDALNKAVELSGVVQKKGFWTDHLFKKDFPKNAKLLGRNLIFISTLY